MRFCKYNALTEIKCFYFSSSLAFFGSSAELAVFRPVFFLTFLIAVAPDIAALADAELDLVIDSRTVLASAGDPPFPCRRLRESCHSRDILTFGTVDIFSEDV